MSGSEWYRGVVASRTAFVKCSDPSDPVVPLISRKSCSEKLRERQNYISLRCNNRLATAHPGVLSDKLVKSAAGPTA